jgi:CDP-glucose 4,6-dehydratase
VSVLADSLAHKWGGGATWSASLESQSPHEDDFLVLDSSKAERELQWSNRYGLDETLKDIVDWEKWFLLKGDSRGASLASIDKFRAQPNPKP